MHKIQRRNNLIEVNSNVHNIVDVYLHYLTTETDPVSETLCILFSRIRDDGRSPKAEKFWKANLPYVTTWNLQWKIFLLTKSKCCASQNIWPITSIKRHTTEITFLDVSKAYSTAWTTGLANRLCTTGIQDSTVLLLLCVVGRSSELNGRTFFRMEANSCFPGPRRDPITVQCVY
jgi:hypothetical protein